MWRFRLLCRICKGLDKGWSELNMYATRVVVSVAKRVSQQAPVPREVTCLGGSQQPNLNVLLHRSLR